MDTQALLAEHEQYKAKGLSLTENDLFMWICLLENFLDKRVELKSEYQEIKQQLEVEKGLRRIALKTQLDEKGKKVHTESTCDANINQEFYDKDKELALIKLQADLVDNKCSVIENYVNIVKLTMKR